MSIFAFVPKKKTELLHQFFLSFFLTLAFGLELASIWAPPLPTMPTHLRVQLILVELQDSRCSELVEKNPLSWLVARLFYNASPAVGSIRKQRMRQFLQLYSYGA